MQSLILVRSFLAAMAVAEQSFVMSCKRSLPSQVRIWNGRLLLQRLADAAEQLAAHGVAKEEEARGLDDVSWSAAGKTRALPYKSLVCST